MHKLTGIVFLFLFLIVTSGLGQTTPSIVADPVFDVQTLYYNHASHIARTSDGSLFAIWVTARSDGQVVFSEYDESFQIWSPPVAISTNPLGGIAHKAGISADNNGNLFVIWQQRDSTSQDYGIMFSMYDGASWSTPLNLTGNDAENEEASIAVSDAGRVFVAWNTDAESDGAEFVLCINSEDGEIWSTPDTLSSADGIIGGTSTTSGRPMLAAATGGKMVCAWHEEPDGHPDRESFLSQYDGESWGDEIVHIDGPDSANSMYPAVACDSQDGIYMMYVSFTSTEKLLLKSKAWDDGQWLAQTDTVVGADISLTKPYLGIDNNDNMYVVYRGDNVADTSFGMEQISYTTSMDGGATWADPTLLSRENHDAGYVTLNPKIAASGVDVLWREVHTPFLDEGDMPADSIAIVYGNIELIETALGDQGENIVRTFDLAQNYPNPFNPTTEIAFTVSQAGRYELAVYNVLGQKIRILLSQHIIAGIHDSTWDGRNEQGTLAGSGIYFYKLQGKQGTLTRKMVLLR